MSLLEFRPQLTRHEAEQLGRAHYQLRATATLLPSERDQNFLLRTDTDDKFVLKLSNATEKRQMIEMEDAAMAHLTKHGIICPQPWPTVSNKTVTTIHHHNQHHFMRLITFLPGEVLAKVPQTPTLLAEIGRFLAQLTKALRTFDHPAVHRHFHWDMQHAHTVIRQYLPLIQDKDRHALVTYFLTQFETEVLPNLPQFRRSTLHNDANDYNLLVDNGRLALLDFGDMVHSCTVFELAIGIAYALLNSPIVQEADLNLHPTQADSPALLETAVSIFRAYHQITPLTAVEHQHLHTLIPIRWCTSVAMAAHQMAQEPDNAYLAISQKGAWTALAQWRLLAPTTTQDTFQQATDPNNNVSSM